MNKAIPIRYSDVRYGVLWILPVLLMCCCGACAYLINAGHHAVDDGNVNSGAVERPLEYDSCVVMGHVSCTSSTNAPIAVVALPVDASGRIIDRQQAYIILESAGEYMMYIPRGDYRIVGLLDANENNIFQNDDIAGACQGRKTLRLKDKSVYTGIDIKLGNMSADALELSGELNIEYHVDSGEYRCRNGQVAKIYDAIFSSGNAETGLWNPSLFMASFGANIFLMEPYDPEKIPILFVHGYNGSPQDWVYFLIRLDRSRYQPWFFYYPSGMSLQLTSRILGAKLAELQGRYRFNKLCLTAHSMGGLVTRALLASGNLETLSDLDVLYITLATPWSGFKSVDRAISLSPRTLPSWYDIASRSIFIKKTLRRRLPDWVAYHFFFGKYDAVSRGRALDERAFAEAKGRYGFNVDHTGILEDRDVYLKYKDVLSDFFTHRPSNK